MSSTEPIDLGPVSRALSDRPDFLAGWLAATPGGAERVKESVGLTDDQLHRLLVCRTPRPDSYLADVTTIAHYIGIDVTALAVALREAAALATLSQRGPSIANDVAFETPGLLAAARDTAAEQLPAAQATAGLRELAASTWRAAPVEVRERRDVQSAVVWASPAMVVLLPRLHIETANRWLTEHGVPPLDNGVGPLRGLLVAWRGQAAIFADGTLTESERRLTIAHEHGHFLLDYVLPRQRILRDAPDLLDVIDGYRSPSDADRARAALARVPLGVHTHLLQRDDHGGAAESTIAAEEDATVYALELLAPWDEMLAVLRPLGDRSGAYPEQLERAAAQLTQHFGLPPDAAKARAAVALAGLGIRPGFFDR